MYDNFRSHQQKTSVLHDDAMSDTTKTQKECKETENKTSIHMTPITTTITSPLRVKKKKPNSTMKTNNLSSSLNMSFEPNSYIYQHNQNKSKLLSSSDEIELSSDQSSSSNTSPPNEPHAYSLNYTPFLSYSKPEVIPTNNEIFKSKHSDSVRSLSDIFGRRFESCMYFIL